MPRAAVTANSALASLGRYWRDSCPRNCSRADLPAWRPDRKYHRKTYNKYRIFIATITAISTFWTALLKNNKWPRINLNHLALQTLCKPAWLDIVSPPHSSKSPANINLVPANMGSSPYLIYMKQAGLHTMGAEPNGCHFAKKHIQIYFFKGICFNVADDFS